MIVISGFEVYVTVREEVLSFTEMFSKYVTFIDAGLSFTALNHNALSVTFQSLFDSTRNVNEPASGDVIFMVSFDRITLLSGP